MKNLKITAAFALSLLSACASIEPPIKASDTVDNELAYVAGKFTRSNSGGFAFVLVNQSSGREYNISLGSDPAFPKDVIDQVVAIKIPPGVYTVPYWFTYGTLTKERSDKHPITNLRLSAPFVASSGSTVFLGNYSAVTEHSNGQTLWSIKSQKISENQARDSFLEAYPLLHKLEFFCQNCWH
ncbi:hypothetical protein [Methylotenera sp. 1P/1]|uniref:hypothetical protein n=1 Tax=Methylotenera sp. 1P/1 TaxID=1131551 RepID=UPI0003666FDA|nr:hypothetical protein [Methylotenera sp. 1P/1]